MPRTASLARAIALGTVLAATAACGPAATAADVDELGAEAAGMLTGVVRDALTDAPLADVLVRVDARTQARTDADGRFVLTGLALDARVLLRAERAGYAPALEHAAARPDRAAHSDLYLAPLASLGELDARTGGTLSTGAGVRVRAPADAFVHADGSPVTGLVQLALATPDPAPVAAREALPGDALARRADGTTAVLSALASVRVRAWQGDEDLALAPGAALDVALPAPSALGADAPAEVPLFRFDADTGAWLEQGRAALLARNALNAGAPAASYVLALDRLEWWSAARPLATACVRGCVQDQSGASLPWSTVRAQGVDYAGSTLARAGADGCFTLEVARGARLELRASERAAQSETSALATAADAPDDGCFDAGTLRVALASTAAPITSPAGAGSTAAGATSAGANAGAPIAVAGGGSVGVASAGPSGANVASSAAASGFPAWALGTNSGAYRPSYSFSLGDWRSRFARNHSARGYLDDLFGDYDGGYDDDEAPTFRVHVLPRLQLYRPLITARPHAVDVTRSHAALVLYPGAHIAITPAPAARARPRALGPVRTPARAGGAARTSAG